MAVKRYDGSQWVTVAGKGDQGTSSSIATWVKTATGGETSVSGNDDSSQPLSYTVGQELVFINGTLQKRGSDYTATTGNSITGLTALAANDVVTVWTVNAFSVTNAISNTIVDAKGDLIVATGADTPGILTAGTTGQVLTVDSTTGTGLKWATPASGTTFAGCRVFDSGTQNISNTTETDITWNSETFDTDGYHSTSSNTERMTIPAGKAGYYLVQTVIRYTTNTSGKTEIYLVKTSGATDTQFALSTAPAASDSGQLASGIVYLAVSDYVRVKVYQNSGGTVTINKASSNSYFSISYLGA